MTRKSHSLIDATTLLSALPAMLGFLPDHSLILVALRSRTRVRVAMRYDLSLTPDGRPAEDLLAVIEGLGQIVHRHGGGPVVGVIVDDRHGPADPRYRRVMSLAHDSLYESGGLAQGFVVTRFEQHAPWQLIWQSGRGPTTARWDRRNDVGTMADPRTSPTAVAEAVSTGRRILADRSEIAAMLTPLPHCESAVCDARKQNPGRGAVGITGPADLLRVVLDAMGDPSVPDCHTMAMLEAAITTIAVRDAALACAVTDMRPDAERLWRMLTRRLQGTGKASAATLLAHLHYIGGEGAYAGVSLDCALDADPDWALAVLLDQALRSGAQPALLWEMIDDSYQIATDLGVPIPGATLRAVG
ncbi:DUF4192 domain-containing protein [Gordonia sp. DT30]|uniref:DUF4192 domain-containing protein n=1 Tax=unclassified Gordonia (in: high G+C Gram-positive bacteria) TaxID=2657482 RepID=UPI003CE8FF7F